MNWSELSSIHVLHVDDDEAFTELTSTVLEREDDTFTIETVASVDAGLDRLTDGVDCIVSDYDMPVRNGIDFLEEVRERDPDLPFILFTGKGSEEVASDAISAGVTDYLQKERGTGQYTVLANRIKNAVDQYRSSAAFEASQQRLSLFIEQSPLGVLEYDETFEIVGLNRAGEEILGYTEDELTGETWETLVTSSSYENVESVTTALSEGSGGFHSVDENVRKDGERIVCEWHNRIVTDEDGDTVAVFSLFQDITERRRHEEHLRQTTARLEALFEHSPDMIDIHDIDGRILDVNPQICEVTGYSESELVGKRVWEIDETADPDEVRALWRQMVDGDRRELNGEYTCRDGSTIPVEVHIRRIDIDGDPRFVVSSRDVSERVERERRLEATTARYRTLVENFPGGRVFMFDEDLRYTLAGGDELETVGPTRDDILDNRPVDLFPPDVAAELTEQYRRALAGAEDTVEQQADGDWYRIRTVPVQGDDGDVVAGMAVSQNITDQKRREERLSRQNDRLEEFASIVSHDLQSPLTVAEGYLDLARTECSSDHFDRIEDAHRRMRVLIDDLLALARDGAEHDTEPVSVTDAVEASWATVETADATLVTDTTHVVETDRSQLRQLLENLIRNAVEHGSTGSQNVRRSDDSVEHGSTNSGPATDDAVEHGSAGDRSASDGLTVTVGDLDDGFYVADDGPGIPEQDRRDVFEKGYSTAGDGTGFGLYIVAELADRHGWTVRAVESDDGGARIEITGVEIVDQDGQARRPRGD